MIDARDRGYLEDMLAYAREAVDLLGDADAVALSGDRMRQHGVARVMEVVGEAASKVSNEGREACPRISWSGAIGTRNRLIHGYRGVDPTVMAATVRVDFPPLIDELERLLAEG